MSRTATTQPAKALLDEFDAYGRVFQENRRYRIREIILLVLVLLSGFAMVILALQPPVVVLKDSASYEPPVLAAIGTAPPIRDVDAKSFFIYSLRKRFGWESMTLMRDWDELHTLMTEQMRTAFASYANELVEAPEDPAAVAPGGSNKVPRVHLWVEQMVRNEVTISRDDVECRKGEPVAGVEQWYCRAFGSIETTPLTVPLAEAVAVRRKVEFRGRFQPAPYSLTRLWGLGIAYLDALEDS